MQPFLPEPLRVVEEPPPSSPRAELAPRAPQPRLWWEIVAVLCIAVFPEIANAVFGRLIDSLPITSTLDSGMRITRSVFVIYAVLFVLRSSGIPRSAIGLTRPITLYWGARDRAGLYLDALARSWEGMLPGFRYIPVLSDPPAGEAWDGRRGLVHQAVLDDFADLSGHNAYVCGAPVMVDVARHSFTAERGLPADAFFADAFTFSIRK